MGVNFRNLQHTAGIFRKRRPSHPKNPVPFRTRTRHPIPASEIPLSRNLTRLTGLTAPMNQLCFFDTETTGLSGGAGNMIFQAGIGYFEENKLVVDQFFISSPGEEPEFLSALNKILTSHPTVITYNGKSFDIPLFNTRLILNRMPEPELTVIDLLHVARSVWKHKLPTFRLSDVERGILKIFRKNDLPGALVPGVYRNYIFGKDNGEILEVLRHNQQDIVSLACLLKHLAIACATEPDPHVLGALAKKYYRNRDINACIDTASRCLCGPVPDKIRKEILFTASMALKQRGELERAARIWIKLENPQGKIELAKFLEHHKKDCAGALAVVNRILKSPSLSSSAKKALRHRQARLRRKLSPEAGRRPAQCE